MNIWDIFMGIPDYFSKAIEFVNPVWTVLATVAAYMLFPNGAYIPAAIAVGIACLLDIATKYYALSVKNGGLKKAFKSGKISSDALWRGTFKKLVSYFIIMILVGLSARVFMIMQIVNFISTIAYSAIFVRESISVLEHLRDADFDTGWMLSILRRKQKELLSIDKKNYKKDESSGEKEDN